MVRPRENNEIFIWLGCLEKPRSIKEINEMFSIRSDVLYKNNLANKLIKENLLRVEKVESKHIYYYSLFDGWFEKLDEDMKKQFKKDKKKWLEFLNNPNTRKVLFSETALKSVFDFEQDKEKIKKIGFSIVLPLISMALTLKYGYTFLKENSEKIDDKVIEHIKEPFKLLGNQIPIFHLDKYVDVLCTKDNLEKLPPVPKNTEFVRKNIDPWWGVIESIIKKII